MGLYGWLTARAGCPRYVQRIHKCSPNLERDDWTFPPPPSLTLRNMPFLCKYLIRRLSYHKTWWYEWSVWPMRSLTIAIGVTYKAIRWMVNLVLEEVILKSWPVWPVHSLTIAIGVTYKATRWTVSLVSEEVILKSWRGTNFENTAKEYKRWSEISPAREPQRESHSERATAMAHIWGQIRLWWSLWFSMEMELYL